MAVGVGNQHTIGFQQAQVARVARREQAARLHPVGGGGPVVFLADIFSVVNRQRHHADTAERGAVEPLGLQKHAAGGQLDAGDGCRNPGEGQRLQRQVLAHQQVAHALVGRCVARRGELDDHMAAGHAGAELGLLTAR